MADGATRRVVTPALEARDVSVRRCGRSLVQRASFTVNRGELLVLLGDRGSGTDTVLAILAGRTEPDAGRVEVDGRPRSRLGPADVVELAVGPVEADAVLGGHCAGSLGRGRVVLLDRALERLDDVAADVMLARCRDAADAGDAVVVATGSATLAARHATTVALFVAGRLLSWGAPAVALVPALQLLAAGSVSELVSCGSAARGSAARPPGR